MALEVNTSVPSKPAARIWWLALHAMLDDDLSPELHRIAAPTLLLWGDRDDLCDRDSQERLAASSPRAQLSVLPGAGHAPHWEDPREVAGNVVSFLNTIQATA